MGLFKKALTIWRNVGLLTTSDLTKWQNAYPAMTASGKSVNTGTALNVAAVWACVRLISETVATLPLVLYRRKEDGSKEPATDDDLYRILHDAPSFDFTAVEFWEGVTLGLSLTGNSYSRKIMSGDRLVSMTPLAADLMCVERDNAMRRRYRYKDPRGSEKVYSEDEIFHVRGFGPSGDIGLSVVQFARQSIGNSLAADEQAGQQFKNGFRASHVLSTPGVLEEEQRKQLKENVIAPFVGSEAAGGVLVLEADMKMQQLSLSMEDAQFIESRGFNVEEICRWFRVPPFMIGHSEKSTSWGTGIEQQMIAFLQFALRPYLSRIEKSISRSLIPAEKRKTMFAEFKVEGLLRADSQARATFYSQMVTNGIYTRNEVRALENMPPMKGGDELTAQAQNVPLGTPPAPPALPAPQGN